MIHYIAVHDEHAGTTERVPTAGLTDYLISITDDDPETRAACETRDMDYLQGITLTDVDDDELDAGVWLRETVTPALSRGQYRQPGGATVRATDWATTRDPGSRYNNRAYPCEADVTYKGHSRHVHGGTEARVGEAIRDAISEVTADAALADLGRLSEARRVAERAFDAARLAQRDGMIHAERIGITRYRIAQVTGLSQPGVAKSLDRC